MTPADIRKFPIVVNHPNAGISRTLLALADLLKEAKKVKTTHQWQLYLAIERVELLKL